MTSRPTSGKDNKPDASQANDWAHAVKDVTPYGEPVKAPDLPSLYAAPITNRPNGQKPAHPSPPPLREPLLQARHQGGVQQAQKKRFLRGHLMLDAELDLHGLNRQQAYLQLRDFIQSAAAQSCRHVRVITGKGCRGAGILRQHFPEWLNDPDIRPYILLYEQAKPKDGGQGAYQLLLRTKRIRAGHE